MDKSKLRTEIKETIDQVPEAALQEVLEFLKAFVGKTENDAKRVKHLRKILNEDKELLKRLAQ